MLLVVRTYVIVNPPPAHFSESKPWHQHSHIQWSINFVQLIVCTDNSACWLRTQIVNHLAFNQQEMAMISYYTTMFTMINNFGFQQKNHAQLPVNLLHLTFHSFFFQALNSPWINLLINVLNSEMVKSSGWSQLSGTNSHSSTNPNSTPAHGGWHCYESISHFLPPVEGTFIATKTAIKNVFSSCPHGVPNSATFRFKHGEVVQLGSQIIKTIYQFWTPVR